MSEVLDHSYDEDELVPADKRQSKVAGPVHHVWIVQISSVGLSTRPEDYYDGYRLPVYPRVLQVGWEIFNEEIAVKPSSKRAPMSAVEIDDGVGENSTEDSKNFQTLGSSPSVKADESLG